MVENCVYDGNKMFIIDFEYKDGWYPATDGDGRTLVARDPAGTDPGDFGEAEKWAISLEANG